MIDDVKIIRSIGKVEKYFVEFQLSQKKFKFRGFFKKNTRFKYRLISN